MLEQRLDDRQAEGQVGHEVVVHDVDVEPVGGRGHGRGLVGEPGEVGGQDAGRDLNGHDSHCAGRARPWDGRAEQAPGWGGPLSLPWVPFGAWKTRAVSISRRRPVRADLLERVRKLLAKAEDDSVTPAEAEALTAKAAELMARYGIDRALLAAARPETDRPADRMIDVTEPVGRRARAPAGRAGHRAALPVRTAAGADRERVHVFGYASDLERAELLYTSLLVQMAHGPGRARGAG